MIIGTAGHIDHGKTSLVRALTGIETDRLKEEKQRGITIDLGFAYVPLEAGGSLGFVDVPGHERLVHTMIAGAASIDLALLVVAADDGVMPQTREHLQILELLGITRAVVALTKTALVDAERALEVELEIEALLAPTPLAGASVFAVDSLSGDGIAALRDRLLAEAAVPHPRATGRAFRFAVDRSFTLAGVGTVVTGSVVAGSVAVGDPLLVLPGGQRARLRSLHAQNRPAERGHAGERCALNLQGSGIGKDAVGRGDWVLDPALPQTSARCDVQLRLLPGEPRALKHWTPVHLHHGAGQVAARVVLLDPEVLRPGESGLAQLVLEAPRPLCHGDRLVLRDTSAQRTMAGGVVLDARAPDRHRRRPARLALLRALAAPDALRRLLALPPFLQARDALLQDWGLTEAGLQALAPGVLVLGGYLAAPGGFHQLRGEALAALQDFHARRPDAQGMTPEALRLALPTRLPKPAFAALAAHLLATAALAQQAHWLRLPGHKPRLGGEDAKLWARIQPLLEATPLQPPRVNDMARQLGVAPPLLRRACKGFARAGQLMEPVPDHFFLRSAVLQMAEAAAALAAEQPGGFSAAEYRDRIGIGRQLAIQLLEYFDRRGITVRRGDSRVAAKPPAQVFGEAG